MNEHTSTPGASQAPQAPFGAGFFAWLRGLGISRGTDRWFAGVAGGIAQRAGIDPIIVRGIFVVLALLGGPGVLLYLAGWLLLPDGRGRIHLEEVFRGRAGTAAVVVTVAVGALVLLPLLLRLFGSVTFGGWNLWNSLGVPNWLTTVTVVLVWIAAITAAIILAGQLFLKHGRKVREENGADQAAPPAADHSNANSASFTAAAGAAVPGQPAPGQPAPGPSAPDQTAPTTDWSARATAGASEFGERATKWGEDIGKQTNEWSARYAEKQDAFRLGAAHVTITLALALLAGGGAALWAMNDGISGSNLQPFGANVIIAAVLAATVVLAISLIFAGVRGRHTGWVGFLAACAVAALVATTIIPWGSRFQPFGTMEVGNDAPGAALIAGNTFVDVETFDPHASTDSIEVWQLAGNSVVTVPGDEPVIVTVRLLAGNISGPSTTGDSLRSAGPLLSRTFDLSGGDANATHVAVYLAAGNVRVEADPTQHLTRTSNDMEYTR